jgi:hypothetical protein
VTKVVRIDETRREEKEFQVQREGRFRKKKKIGSV